MGIRTVINQIENVYLPISEEIFPKGTRILKTLTLYEFYCKQTNSSHTQFILSRILKSQKRI